MAIRSDISRDNDDREKVLSRMRDRMTAAISFVGSSRQNQLQDLKFLAGSPDNQWQWDEGALATRASTVNGTAQRPCLTINKLPQHVKMVTNEQRQNRPSAKVVPKDGEGDTEVATVLTGMIRHIEYISDADVAYDTACESQVAHGEGYIRLLTEYSDPKTFNQDIRIKRVRNPFSVFMDPTIEDPCGMDAEWCIISEDIGKDEYEREWGKDFSTVSALEQSGIGDSSLGWVHEESLRIVEYFFAEYTERQLGEFNDGTVAFLDSAEGKAALAATGKPKRTRRSIDRKIRWIKSNGLDILEETEWLGKWIPVIRVVGNEYEVDGELHVSGLVRNAKDPQRMYNYWASQEAEMLALAPKAPYVVAAGQIEGFEKQWQTANTSNWAYLEYNAVSDDAQNLLPAPQRSQPPMVQSGLIAAKQAATDDLKSVTGQYDASLGQTSNERSGKAILARQQQGDTGTFHYVDNLARAIRYIARQCVDLIPKVYDVARSARILGLDNEVSMVKLNPNQQSAVIEKRDQNGALIEKSYNPDVGEYDVMVATGPGYMSKRQEALDAMTQILQNNPQLWPVVGDLLVRNMDWPGAPEMAERLAKTLDPRVTSDDSPQVMELQKQVEALTQELQLTSKTMTDYKTSADAAKGEVIVYEAHIKAFDALTKRFAALKDVDTNDKRIHDMILGMLDAKDALSTGNLSAGFDAMQQDVDNNAAQTAAPEGAQAPEGQDAPAPAGMPADPGQDPTADAGGAGGLPGGEAAQPGHDMGPPAADGGQ